MIMVQIWVSIALLVLVEAIKCSQIVPPLYRYDDYGQCHQKETHAGVYCFVKVVFNEDRDPFDTPRIISDFRRNLLGWGVCVKECQQELASIDEEDRLSLFQPKFEINFTYILPADLWGQYLEPFKAHYSELINICVNNRLKRAYNFDRLAYSEIEYCSSKDHVPEISSRSPDWPMIAFYGIVLALIGLLVGANMIDCLGHDQMKVHVIVSSFSVRRNWGRLTEQSGSDLYRDFGFIDGIRVPLSLLVMSVHCLMIAGAMPLTNPEYIEKVFKNSFMVDFTSSCAVPVQIFFAISGLLLTTSILKDADQMHKLDAQYFWDKIKSRLVRIAPVYYFVLLASIVFPDLPGVQVGSLGYLSLIQEQARCRKRWWTNVFFVNNLPIFASEGCNLQSWYLAADQQLFLVTLLLVTACWRFPKQAKSILWSSVVVSVAIPAGIVYLNELESSLPIKLSDIQFLVMYQPWFNQVYMPSYSNLNSYIAGAVVGYMYHQHKDKKLELDLSLLYKICKRARAPLLALAYLSTFIFYRYEIPRSSWLTMLHTILYRNVGVIAMCVTFVECFRNPPGSIRKFLSSKPMTSLGKLSYSVYVLHVPMGRFIINWFPPTMELKLWNLVWMGPSFVSVYLVGFCAYFCIEQPISLLLKHYLLGKR